MLQVFGFMRQGAKLTAESLALRFAGLCELDKIAASATQRAQTERTALREWAKRDGFAAELERLEHPVVEAVPDRNEPRVPVRVIESFSTTWERIAEYGAGGEVVELPRSLAKKLVSRGIVEYVPEGTPLFRHQIAWPR